VASGRALECTRCLFRHAVGKEDVLSRFLLLQLLIERACQNLNIEGNTDAMAPADLQRCVICIPALRAFPVSQVYSRALSPGVTHVTLKTNTREML